MEEFTLSSILGDLLANIVASRKSLLQQVHSNLGSGDLVLLWGSPGCGKSWILDQIAAACRKTEHPLIAVDLARLAGGEKADPQSLLDIWPGERDASATPESQALQIVKNTIQLPAVVLLDNLDMLLRRDEELFHWMERNLVTPLLAQAGNMIFATSKLPIQRQWRTFETRRRCQTIHLQPLEPEDVAQWFSLPSAEAAEVWAMTAGHPKAMEWYQENARLEGMQTQSYIDVQARNYFLEGLSPDLAQLAGMLSHIRWYNVALLRRLLPGAQQNDDSFFLEKINKLNRAGLSTWDIERGAYRFTDPAVRLLLARNERARGLAESARVHQVSQAYYAGETRYIDYLADTFPEMIYHFLWWKLTTGCDTPQAARACLDWLRTNPVHEWENASEKDWSSVLEILDGSFFLQTSQDKERDFAEQDALNARKYAANELKNLFPSDAYSELLEFVRSMRQTTQENQK